MGVWIILTLVVLGIGIAILVIAILGYWNIVRPKLRRKRLLENQRYNELLLATFSTPKLSNENTLMSRRVLELEKTEREIERANRLIENINVTPPSVSTNDKDKYDNTFSNITKFLVSETALVTVAGTEHFFYELIDSTEVDPAEIIEVLREDPEAFFTLIGQFAKVALSPTFTNITEMSELLIQLKEAASGFVELDFDQFFDVDFDPSIFDPDFEFSVDFHFPWITTLFSIGREFKLLNDGKTELDTAIKNTLLDIAGTGGGGAVGATIGTTIAPGIGTILGGLAGAIIGRLITNKVKFKPLEKAYQKYITTFEEVREKMSSSVKQLAQRFWDYVAQEQKRFDRTVGYFPRVSNDNGVVDISNSLIKATYTDIHNAKFKLNIATKRARSEIQDRWYHKVFGIAVAKDTNVLIGQQYNQLLSLLEEIEAEVKLAEQDNSQPLVALHTVSKLPIIIDGEAQGQMQLASNEFLALVDLRNQELHTWLNSAQVLKQDIVNNIQTFWQIEMENEQEKWRKWQMQVADLAASVEEERLKLKK